VTTPSRLWLISNTLLPTLSWPPLIQPFNVWPRVCALIRPSLSMRMRMSALKVGL